MSALGAFLRGLVEDLPGIGDVRLHLFHRHAEGGPWTLVVQASSGAAMEDELRAGTALWPVTASPGDLAVMEAFFVEDWRTVRYFGVRANGSLGSLPDPEVERWTMPEAQRWVGDERARGRGDLLHLWQDGAYTAWMVDLVLHLGLPREPLLAALLAALDVRAALARDPQRPLAERAGRLLDTLEAWTRGAVGLLDLRRARLQRRPLGTFPVELRRDDPWHLVREGLGNLVDCALAPTTGEAWEAAWFALDRLEAFRLQIERRQPLDTAQRFRRAYDWAFGDVVLALTQPEPGRRP